ncbi:MAG: hypothetical protein R3191_00640 [Anaerolineales bacterium]|nr:hypothetical protein [Anaerolineales bacterium]
MLSRSSQQRLAWILITIGVLAWAPYFYALAEGATPNILPYLGVHLAGVLSGAWLRSRSSPVREDDGSGSRRRRLATVLVILGVLAWAPYFYLNEIAHQSQPVGPYLTAHLIGVLGGSAMRISVMVENYLSDRSKEDSGPQSGAD